MTAKAWSPGRADENVKVMSGQVVEVKSRDQGRDNSRQRINDEEGGTIWKLTKRISTGGLRDRYIQAADKLPPPAPAVPKAYR